MNTKAIWVGLFSVSLFSACAAPADTDGPASSGAIVAADSAATTQCVQNVLCVAGTHFDTTVCKCVPNPSICTSKEDGPCGGFTQNPCRCAPGLTCVPNRIPDVPGTCQPARCCPAAWDMYTCREENGGTGFNCHNPALACPSSLICGGGGCDFEVSGRCPVCDPIVCPAGQVFSRDLCKCVGCVTAADCTGPLPQVCEVCADGSTGCAHWTCVANTCQVATCN